ncbi:MAG: isoprenylcysteine carboxylmethyltransferase family protein [Dehalococcoidales bacterium]|nr:isoprenylcysteine carboxylmethyltransferase family protein [Dehalococcoidales bacterium]
MRGTDYKEIFWMTVLTLLCIACFPVNPLALTGIVEPCDYLVLSVLGWIVWGAGMVLVMAPIVTFPRRGGVPKGKSFVHTTRLVDTGIYAVVRHPQYLGGVLAVFIATMLLYPHWLFVVMGVPGIVILYLSTRGEEKRLLERFGDDYRSYMQRVPRMNIVLGIIRKIGKKKDDR